MLEELSNQRADSDERWDGAGDVDQDQRPPPAAADASPLNRSELEASDSFT
jgi:hypothetical protein